MDALEIFRMEAPEFSDIPDDDVVVEGKVIKRGVKTYMELYKDLISQKRFGSMYEKALAYLTAHKLKMAGYGADDGIGSVAVGLRVSSVSEGETSVSFGTSQRVNISPDAEYSLTVYGLSFLQLRRLAIVPITSAGEGGVCPPQW